MLSKETRMKYDFKLTVEVDSFYEIDVRIPFQAYDQRDAASYTDYRNETKRFQTDKDVERWISENPNAEIKSAVLIVNVLKDFVK